MILGEDLCTHGHVWYSCKVCDDEDPRPPIPYLRKNPEVASQIEAILGLPSDRWTDMHMDLSMDGPALVHVTFMLTTDQVTALAALAVEGAI